MTALRRTVKNRDAPMRLLYLQTICDKNNRSRAHGNHTDAISWARPKRLSCAHREKS